MPEGLQLGRLGAEAFVGGDAAARLRAFPVATWTWTFHGSLGGIPSAQISVLRVDDNMPLAVSVMTLQQGYGQDAIAWTPKGWSPAAGTTYRVTVSGLSGGDVTYDVKPVNCN